MVSSGGWRQGDGKINIIWLDVGYHEGSRFSNGGGLADAYYSV